MCVLVCVVLCVLVLVSVCVVRCVLVCVPVCVVRCVLVLVPACVLVCVLMRVLVFPLPRGEEVVAVASMNYDPIVSRVAEILGSGKLIRKRDVE